MDGAAYSDEVPCTLLLFNNANGPVPYVTMESLLNSRYFFCFR